MTTTVRELDPRMVGYSSKACPACGHRFFTSAALYEHRESCLPPLPPTPPRVSPAGYAKQQERGRQIAAENNAKRRRCDTCDHTSTAAGLGAHQKSTGHVGWSSA